MRSTTTFSEDLRERMQLAFRDAENLMRATECSGRIWQVIDLGFGPMRRMTSGVKIKIA